MPWLSKLAALPHQNADGGRRNAKSLQDNNNNKLYGKRKLTGKIEESGQAGKIFFARVTKSHGDFLGLFHAEGKSFLPAKHVYPKAYREQ